MSAQTAPTETAPARGGGRLDALRPRLLAVGQRISNAPIWLSVLVAVIILLAFPPLFGSSYVLRVATTIGITVILALGLTILMGGSGEMSFAHAGFYGIGAYALAILVTRSHVAFWPALVLVVLIGFAIGAIIGIPALRTHGLTFAIVTLGFGLIASDVFNGWRSVTGGSVGIAGIPPTDLSWIPVLGSSSLAVPTRSYYLVWAIALVTVVFVLALFRGDYGRVLRGIRGDAGLVEGLGYRPGHYRLLAFALSAAVAALAGGLYAQYIGFVSPESFTFVVAFSALAIVAIGGSRNPWGTVVSGIVLSAIPEVLRFVDDYRLVVYAVILYLVLLGRTRMGWRG